MLPGPLSKLFFLQKNSEIWNEINTTTIRGFFTFNVYERYSFQGVRLDNQLEFADVPYFFNGLRII